MLKLSRYSTTGLLFILFIFTLIGTEFLYSQSSGSPRYGMSLEKWEQNQKSVELKSNINPVSGGSSSVINRGFEAGDLSGWFVQDVNFPFYPIQVGAAGVQPWDEFFVSDPTEGSFALLHGWDGENGTIILEQDVAVPSNAVSLEFDYRAAWNLELGSATIDRVFKVDIEPSGGGIPLLTDTVLIAVAPTINNDTGNLHGSIDISAFANSTMRIVFEWTVPEDFSGPGFFQLDNIYIKYTGPQIIVADFVAFGIQEVGTSSFPRIITISSVGTSNCTVSGISDPGTPFILSNLPTLPVVIAPGGSETFEVTFSPASSGGFNSTITVSSDDAVNPAKSISLSGEGVVFTPAMSGVCYASTGYNDGGRFLTIDINTGVGTLIGDTGLDAAPGLAINADGDIYCISSNPAILHRVDAGSGLAIPVGSTGIDFMDAIAFDGNGVLYGLGGETFNSGLYRIDLLTGATTFIASTGDAMRGMAFDPTDGKLWASTGADIDNIYTINVSTGAATLVGTTGLGGSTPDIAFDQNGNLYGAKGGSTNNLISISKTSGTGTVIGPIGFTSVSGMAARLNRVVGVDDEKDSEIPNSYALEQNYPNPFNPSTVISYQIPNAGYVTLKIYGVLGNEIITLVSGEKIAGSYEIEFDGEGLSSGIYFYQLNVRPSTSSGRQFVETRKMILMK